MVDVLSATALSASKRLTAGGVKFHLNFFLKEAESRGWGQSPGPQGQMALIPAPEAATPVGATFQTLATQGPLA